MMRRKKVVYVLNGRSPEKNYHFSNCRSKIYRSVLMDNHGDNTNAKNFDYLMNNHILDDHNNYVLITSEDQLDYINSNSELLRYYRTHESQFICVKFDASHPVNYLTSKLNYYNKCPLYTPYVKILTGSEIKSLPKGQVLHHAIKLDKGSGGNTVFLVTNDNYELYMNKLVDTESYIFEPIYDGFYFDHLWSDVLIVDGKVSFVTFACDSFRDKVSTNPYWNPIYLTTRYDDLIRDFLNDIIVKFDIKSGIMEPEFVYDSLTDSLILIDTNPRWSAGSSYGLHQIAKDYLPKDFDILDYYFKGKSFKVKDVLKGPDYYLATMYVKV